MPWENVLEASIRREHARIVRTRALISIAVLIGLVALVAIAFAVSRRSSSLPVIPCPDDLRVDTDKGRGWLACLDYGSNPPIVPEPAKP